MTISALDDLQRTRFEWPESLVLELIGESYHAQDDGDRWMAAQGHARFLRALVGQETKPTDRRELIAACAARGIGADAIESAEQVVFDELSRLVTKRFRNSPRLAALYLAQLHSAREALPTQAQAPRKPAASSIKRAPLRLSPSLAATV